MVDNTAFAKRLAEIQAEYKLTPASFADAIGVSRASISHILSGRHKPSLSFVMSIVKQYPAVNIYWLLNGTGNFPSAPEKIKEKPKMIEEVTEENLSIKGAPKTKSTEKTIKRVMVFFEDGTFESYEP